MNDPLNIMFHTVAPWCPSGYGQQTRQMLRMISEYGANTACVCYEGLQHGILDIDGIRYYPSILDPFAEDAVMLHGYHFQPDAVFSFTDIWALNETALIEMRELGFYWIPIVPIDYEPVPEKILSRLRHANEIVTISPFGRRELERVGMASTYIPHTVDTNVFKPHDRAACREEFGLPTDAFLFGMVAANGTNPPRKGFQKVLDCFARFRRNHKDAALYLHTLYHREGGFPIETYLDTVGVREAVFTLEDYTKMFLLDDKAMARLFSCFDCLLNPSTHEGFGVPIIEAMACGVPVIANNFSSMRDLVEDGVTGYKTESAGKRFTPIGSYVSEPCPESLYSLMETIYADDREGMGRRCRSFVEQHFDTNLVRDRHWYPFLEKLKQRG